MKKTFLFVYSFILFFTSCQMHKKVIDTAAIVVPDSYHGNIVIFYEQQYEKGKIEYKNGKHFIYTPDDGIVFTKYKLGEGYIEFYDENEKRRKDAPTLNPQKLEDDTYFVIGGRYGVFYLNDDKKSVHIRYSVFSAGLGRELKNEGSYLDDKEIRGIYETTLKQLAGEK